MNTLDTIQIPEKRIRQFSPNSGRCHVALDWVQLHVSSATRWAEHTTSKYQMKITGRSKVFREIYSIIRIADNQTVATYATDAVEAILGEGHGILKIENRELYLHGSDLYAYTCELLAHLNLKFIGITRLDIAYDFHRFAHGRDPQNFIRDFLTGDILKFHKAKFRVAGVHGDRNEFQTISFGAKTSMVQYKLYNKTKEQEEASRKPYIWESWEKKSSLDVTKDIWRLEFTINSNTSTLLNEKSFIDFHSLEVLKVGNWLSLYRALYEKYFRFVRNDKTKSRKDRMMEITLLEFPVSMPEACTIQKINAVSKDSTRSTRIFIKKMNDLNTEMRGIDDDFVGDARSLVSKLISLYDLRQWADRKGIDYDQLNYRNDLQDVIFPISTGNQYPTQSRLY